MIISTRESQQVREKVLRLGVSQISGASRTSVGGYAEEERPHDSEQFDVSDQRSLGRGCPLAHGAWAIFRRSAPPATARAAPATAS